MKIKAEKACLVLSATSIVFSLLALLTMNAKKEEASVGPIEEHYEMSRYHYVYLEHTKLKMMLYTIDVSYETAEGCFEEEPSEEMNCLMYATVPIGRYYITAYNHEETGSKRTVSGAICHDGTITTCAADPKYHRFGEYLEIGGRLYRVEDTGSAVKRKHIDIYFSSYKTMAKYGSHYETIYKVEFLFGKPKDE